jgi:Winged helix DNA-binding domain
MTRGGWLNLYMNSGEILKLRLFNTGLSKPRFKTPAQAVAYLGAIQAQDFPFAKWSLGMRVQNATNKTIEDAYNKGAILRTHIMRPTWHFVTPENIRWMQELTAPRVKAFMAHYNRKLELNEKLFAKTNKAIVKALETHRYLTRPELKEILSGIGIKTDVQRLAHIVAWAELDALICSGPMRGKKFTYALLDERAPKTKKLSKEEALAKLALIYFKSHGPAQAKDFSWWSGLSMEDAKMAIRLLGPKLEHETVNEKQYYFFEPAKKMPAGPRAFLLSIFDEYTIAYKDRSDLDGQIFMQKMMARGNAFTLVMILEGKAAGTWKRTVNKDGFEITLKPFEALQQKDKRAFEKEMLRLAKFFGTKAG